MTEQHHPQREDADAVARAVVVPVEAVEAERLAEAAEEEATATLEERLGSRPQVVEWRALVRDPVVRERQSGNVGRRAEVLEEGLGQRVLAPRLREQRTLIPDQLARATGQETRDEEGQGIDRGRVVLQRPALQVLPVLAAGAEERPVLTPKEAVRDAPEDEARVALVRGELATLTDDPLRLVGAVLRREQDDGLAVLDRGEELRDVDRDRGRQLRLDHESRALLLLRRHRELRELHDRVVALRLRQPVETRIRSRAVELAHGGVKFRPKSRNDTGSAHDRGDFFLTASSHGTSSIAMATPHSSTMPEPQTAKLVRRFSRLISALYFGYIKKKKTIGKIKKNQFDRFLYHRKTLIVKIAPLSYHFSGFIVSK